MTAESTSIADAQRDMRFAYFGGAPGLLVSGLAWLASGFAAIIYTSSAAIITLFVGGMLIHPLSVLLVKMLGRPGAHTRGNPLGTLALEGTVQLILCLSLAYAISLVRTEWFFPAMLVIIGGRYFTFSTLYGMRLYWACGVALAGAAIVLLMFQAPFVWGAFIGAAIEITFAAIVCAAEVKLPTRS
jgi:hypothetical protein